MKICTANGHLTRDPVKQRDGDNAFGTLAVKTVGAHGAVETEYIDLICPGEIGARLLQFGKKGVALIVNGREHLKTFKGRNGEGKVNEIYVTSLELGKD